MWDSRKIKFDRHHSNQLNFPIDKEKDNASFHDKQSKSSHLMLASDETQRITYLPHRSKHVFFSDANITGY